METRGLEGEPHVTFVKKADIIFRHDPVGIDKYQRGNSQAAIPVFLARPPPPATWC